MLNWMLDHSYKPYFGKTLFISSLPLSSTKVPPNFLGNPSNHNGWHHHPPLLLARLQVRRLPPMTKHAHHLTLQGLRLYVTLLCFHKHMNCRDCCLCKLHTRINISICKYHADTGSSHVQYLDVCRKQRVINDQLMKINHAASIPPMCTAQLHFLTRHRKTAQTGHSPGTSRSLEVHSLVLTWWVPC